MRTFLPCIVALAAATAACAALPGHSDRLDCATAGADTTGWARVADSSGFSFLLPPGFRENKVQPVDSHVRGFEADGLSLSLDFGHAPAEPRAAVDSLDAHLECPARIGGHDAVITLTWPDRLAYGVAATWPDVSGGMRLWIGGAANTPNGQRALLTVLRSVRFSQP